MKSLRILTTILIFIFASYTNSVLYPGPHWHIKTECGTVQLRKIVRESRYDAALEGYQDEEIPTILVKFPSGEEKLEIGIDAYEKLKLKSNYYRSTVVDNETPTLYKILNWLGLICFLWFIVELIHGFIKFLS